MAGFTGFSEEDIRRFKMQGESIDLNENTRKEPAKKATMNSSGKRSKPREKIRTKSNSNAVKTNVKVSDYSSSGIESDVKETPAKPSKEEVVHQAIIQEKTREIEVVMESEKVKEIELSNLEKMQQKQKEMEIINKKKEKMLQAALKQRYAKTKRETETLKLVQKELNHLDNLLYSDVQVLRDKIDNACREFDSARKRYERAEKEFINAKVNLHDKTELKDQLAEHLCSIIQQNEERKAKKLAELMAKLELADREVNFDEAECDSNDIIGKTNSNSHEIQEASDVKTSSNNDRNLSTSVETVSSEKIAHDIVKEHIASDNRTVETQSIA